ncbi:hypothetical protein EMIHUDRAFT_117094, partial [Emiliania huxleyi CCMP1516]|uniref:PARP-type domain-containing protein n=2 Tax=Emiliania huxleyi TaxID=2903 RepID=A0A0D3JDJ6_EMIH1
MMEPEPTSYEVVELAKSGRSTCKKCRQLILKDTLRVGKVYRDQDDRERKNYYHPACWPVPRKLTSIEEVRGFASLTQEQREVLELRFRQPRAVGAKKGKAPAEVQAQAPPALSAEDAAEQEWLHGQAATAAAAPSAEESDAATSWRARAPPGFPPDQLDFLLSQPAAECAEAVPAMAEALAALVAAGDASPTALEQREALRFSIAVAKARAAAPPAPPE